MQPCKTSSARLCLKCILSSPNTHQHHTHPRTPQETLTSKTTKPLSNKNNLSYDLKTLRHLEIQALLDIICTKIRENYDKPQLPLLKKYLISQEKTLKQVHQKRNSAHLLAQAHEIRVTPLNTTINTAWILSTDCKKSYAHSSVQLPPQMRTNISPV